MLLPDPIEKEIRRHLKTRAREASSALKSAQTQAPLLKKLPDWPLNKVKKKDIVDDLLNRASAELDEFLAFYKVKNLGYNGVDIAAVMESYDKQLPPFAAGEKEKEFPDAFAIAILDVFHASLNESIIVISSDDDIQKACEARPHLFHFNSLSSFIESVEVHNNKLISTCLDLLAKDDSLLSKAISTDFENLGFTLRDDWSADVHRVIVDNVEFHEVNITGARGSTCFASFTATISFRAETTYDDYDTAVWDSEEKVAIPMHRHDAEIEATTFISGGVAIHIDPEHSHITQVDDLEIDQDTIDISLREDW